jgi:hypothetical protein
MFNNNNTNNNIITILDDTDDDDEDLWKNYHPIFKKAATKLTVSSSSKENNIKADDDRKPAAATQPLLQLGTFQLDFSNNSSSDLAVGQTVILRRGASNVRCVLRAVSFIQNDPFSLTQQLFYFFQH